RRKADARQHRRRNALRDRAEVEVRRGERAEHPGLVLAAVVDDACRAHAADDDHDRDHHHADRHRRARHHDPLALDPMASYAYTAINAAALELRGQVQAPTAAAAREALRVQGLLAELLTELPGNGSAAGKVPIAGIETHASGGSASRGPLKGVKTRSLQI